jgi:hypothetical protein
MNPVDITRQEPGGERPQQAGSRRNTAWEQRQVAYAIVFAHKPTHLHT